MLSNNLFISKLLVEKLLRKTTCQWALSPTLHSGISRETVWVALRPKVLELYQNAHLQHGLARGRPNSPQKPQKSMCKLNRPVHPLKHHLPARRGTKASREFSLENASFDKVVL